MTPLARHHCPAEACRVTIPASKFMCLADWRLVPKKLKDAVWLTYVPGQEPTAEHLEVAAEAIAAVAAKKLAKANRLAKIPSPDRTQP